MTRLSIPFVELAREATLPTIFFIAGLFAANLVTQDYDLVIVKGRVNDPEPKCQANYGVSISSIAAREISNLQTDDIV